MDGAVDALFARQHGLITRAQALANGVTDRQIAYRLRTRRWQRAHAGVYQLASAARTHEQRLLAAVLVAGRGAAVSHRAAVVVWGLRGYSCRIVEVSRPSTARVAPDGAVVHRLPDLRGASNVARRRGLPVTTPARTLLDLGAVTKPELVVRCMEEWLADRLVTIEQLRLALARHAGRGRPGGGVLRRALADRALGDGVADSGAEALLADVLAHAGLPPPEHHHRVVRGGVVLAELDYAYPAARIALEVDGYGVHVRSRAIFERDRKRQNELEIDGWRFLRFTATQLRDRAAVADQVRRMLVTAGTHRFPEVG